MTENEWAKKVGQQKAVKVFYGQTSAHFKWFLESHGRRVLQDKLNFLQSIPTFFESELL